MSILLERDDGRLPADQLPSPCAILDVPPALMAACTTTPAAAQDHHSGTNSNGTTTSSAGFALQQQQEAEQLLARVHQGPQHIAHHIMSGKKLDKRYDIPVNLGYLDGLPDHQPALGSGQLDVIVGPMFAGKTTALLQQVRAGVEAVGLTGDSSGAV